MTLRRLDRDRAGATAIEYGLIAGLIALVALGASGPLSQALSDNYDLLGEAVEGAEAVPGDGK